VKDLEGNVFSYFVAIGAGLSFGIAVVFLPSFWLFNKLRGGKTNHVKQAAWK
jgi:hypothetical protein